MLVRLRNAFARELGAELPAATVFSASDIRGLARALGEVLPERDTAAQAGERRPEARRPEAAVEVPESELRPATRDVLRLLRSARPGMPDAAHAVGLASGSPRPRPARSSPTSSPVSPAGTPRCAPRS